MIGIKTKVTGDADKILGQLQGLSKMLEGPGMEMMQELGKEAMQDVQERFDTSGYGTWAPLSPITIARKGNDTILIDTGNMQRAVGIGEITDRRVTVTVPTGGKDRKEEVPPKHQLGDPKHNLPQRKIVEVTDKLMQRLDPKVEEWRERWKN